MSTPILFLCAGVGLAIVMTGAWAIVMRGGKSGWIDTIWSFAVGLAGIGLALAPADGWASDAMRRWMVAGLAATWALRLGLHIASRTAGGHDDPRYTQLMKEWGSAAPWRLWLFLQIQAAAALLLAAAIFLAAHQPDPSMRAEDWIGLLLFAAAIVGEGAADAQLARFRSDPRNRGRVCDVGLWSVSRHPNYFFEWLGWLAYAVIAADFAGTYPWGWLALAGPALMYWLLVHASGIPPLEEHMARSRGAAFRAYQQRVNAFFPGPPRTQNSEGAAS